MRTPYGAWRATSTSGRWTVLSGPSSMVVMQPAGADSSDLVNQLWDQLLASVSITDITARLTGFGLDAMPDLAVIFWSQGQLHCLLRGQVRVVEADTGDLLATGQGAWTWHEAHLPARRVRVVLDDVDPDELLRLPLVIGAVGASSILLEADDAEPTPDVEPDPEPLAEPEPDPEPLAAPEPETALEPEPEAPPSGRQTEPEPTEVLGGRPPYAAGQEPGAQTEEPQPASGLAMGSFGQGRYGTTGPWGALGFEADRDGTILEHGKPAFVPAEPAPFPPAQTPVPERVEPLEPEPPESSTPEPAEPPVRERPEPPTSSAGEAPARAIPATSAGARRPLVRPVVVGRAPPVPGDDPEAEALRVPSPNHDISRTHLRIEPRGWQIEVTDLNSTNGTLVTSPDGQTRRLTPGQPTEVGLGWTIDIGDGQKILLEPPD